MGDLFSVITNKGEFSKDLLKMLAKNSIRRPTDIAAAIDKEDNEFNSVIGSFIRRDSAILEKTIDHLDRTMVEFVSPYGLLHQLYKAQPSLFWLREPRFRRQQYVACVLPAAFNLNADTYTKLRVTEQWIKLGYSPLIIFETQLLASYYAPRVQKSVGHVARELVAESKHAQDVIDGFLSQRAAFISDLEVLARMSLADFESEVTTLKPNPRKNDRSPEIANLRVQNTAITLKELKRQFNIALFVADNQYFPGYNAQTHLDIPMHLVPLLPYCDGKREDTSKQLTFPNIHLETTPPWVLYFYAQTLTNISLDQFAKVINPVELSLRKMSQLVHHHVLESTITRPEAIANNSDLTAKWLGESEYILQRTITEMYKTLDKTFHGPRFVIKTNPDPKLLLNSLRPNDRPYVLGEDPLALLLPDSDTRSAIERLNYKTDQKQVDSLRALLKETLTKDLAL